MLDYLNLNYIDNKGEMRGESFHEIIENHGDVYAQNGARDTSAKMQMNYRDA